MKNSIIKNYSTWLAESLQVLEAVTDPTAAYKAGDRAGLVELAQANDSAEVKAHPAYASVMQWWKNGEGDLNLWKSLVKKSSDAKTDKTRSLKSIYYWSGGAIGGSNKILDSFYKVADAIIKNGTKTGASEERISQLKQAVETLKDRQAKGFILKTGNLLGSIIPAALTDGVFTTGGENIQVADELAKPAPNKALVGVLKNWKLTGNSTELTKDPLTSVNFLADKLKDQAGADAFWTASMKISDADKKAMLDNFKAAADKYVAKKKVADLTFDKAILTATNLYILPKNEKITVTQAVQTGQPTQVTQSFSYPENPKGDTASPAFQKGLQLFEDDGTAIKQQAASELAASVKSAVDAVKAAGGTITGVKTWGYSSTSQVPTSYGSDPNNKQWKPENNVKLATDRLASINKALADSLTANGVTVAPTVETTKNIADANRGPAWTEKDRTDPKWGKAGARSQEYQTTYGPWRYAVAFFELTYTKTSTTPPEVASTASPSGEWKSMINWADESVSIEINIPKIRFGTGYSKSPNPIQKGKPLPCPVWD